MAKIQVNYWRGTTKLTATATTYRGAVRIANRNQNTYGPSFYDAQGRKLHDDGVGLCYDEPEVEQLADGTTVERRVYAV